MLIKHGFKLHYLLTFVQIKSIKTRGFVLLVEQTPGRTISIFSTENCIYRYLIVFMVIVALTRKEGNGEGD